EHHMFARGFHSGTIENIAQAWPGETGGTDRSFAPLDAGDLRALQIAAVAGAFERVHNGMGLDFRKLGQAERERLFHFPANCESPLGCIEFAGLVHVIAYEEVRNGSKPRVKVFDRSFDIDETERAKNHSVFAGNITRLPL